MKASAVLLASIGVSLALGVAARSAAGPTPSFAATVWYRVSPNPSSVVIRDLNGDGKPDLAIANAREDYEDDANNGVGTVSIRLNRGDGTFLPRRDYRTGAGTVSVAAGDLNGDGVPDLVTANSDAGSVSVLPAGGTAAFCPRMTTRPEKARTPSLWAT